MPAFKVFAIIQEFDDDLWDEMKKRMPRRIINDKRRWLKIQYQRTIISSKDSHQAATMGKRSMQETPSEKHLVVTKG